MTAVAVGQFSAAVAAEIARGKAAGLYAQKVEVKAEMNPGPDWRALIGDCAASGPEV